jgi:hypothetical protein
MKASFLRSRKRRRAVLVLPSHRADLAPHLKAKNFYVITLPADALDEQSMGMWLSARTLITDQPGELKYDVPVLEFSVIDISEVKTNDAAAIADIVSRAWTKYRLKTEGWFLLHLKEDGNHQIEFPE